MPLNKDISAQTKLLNSYYLSILKKEEPTEPKSEEKYPWFFKRISNSKYGNTPLHIAITQQSTQSALALCYKAISEKQVKKLFIFDTFPSISSTALILAAKTGNNRVAMALISAAGAQSKLLDKQDYLGNTALHYAAITRNNTLIQALIESGANIKIVNKRKVVAQFYYDSHFASDAIDYNYGYFEDHRMNQVHDWDSRYCGTVALSFSFYRWFMAHILCNFVNEESELNVPVVLENKTFHAGCCERSKVYETTTEQTVLDLARWHVENYEVVMDIRIYNAIKNTLYTLRENSFSAEVSAAIYVENKKQYDFKL